MDDYQRLVQQFERVFQRNLVTYHLVLHQWLASRMEEEQLLSEQFDDIEIEALKRIGITDEFLEWMHEQGRYTEELGTDEEDFGVLLRFQVTPSDIAEYHKNLVEEE